MLQKIFFFLFLFIGGGTLLAQTASEALRFSFFNPSGTARSVATANALGALGGDMSAISQNPASMASYRRDEFSISTGLQFNNTTSVLSNAVSGTNFPNIEKDSKMTLEHIGLVSASHTPNRSGWKTTSWGITLNRLASFRGEMQYQGISRGTITDRFIELANGKNPGDLDDFEAGLAYDVGAIYQLQNSNFYDNDFAPNEAVSKSQVLMTDGYVQDFSIALAANFEEKIMVGGSLSFPFYKYEEESVYRENDEENTNDVFDNLRYNEYIDQEGIGFNAKFGVIFKPIYNLRIGGAVHTPTWWGIDESYNTSMEYSFVQEGNSSKFSEDSPNGFYDYRVRSPWRFVTNIALIEKKLGFVTAEVEFINYADTEYDFHTAGSSQDLNIERELNDQIEELYDMAINYKIGMELRLMQGLKLRGGYSNIGTPFAANGTNRQSYSGGLGYTKYNSSPSSQLNNTYDTALFIDLAYRYSKYADTYTPYQTTGSEMQVINNDYITNRFILTLGFKF